MADSRDIREPTDVLVSHREMQARSAVGRRMAEAQALLRDLRALHAADGDAASARTLALREWALAEVGRAAQDWVRFGGDVRLILPADALPGLGGSAWVHTASPASGAASSETVPAPGAAAGAEATAGLEGSDDAAADAPAGTEDGAAAPDGESAPAPAEERPAFLPPPPPRTRAQRGADAAGPAHRASADRENRAADLKALVQGFGRPRWARDGEGAPQAIDPVALAGLGDLLAETPMPEPDPMDKLSVRRELELLLAVTSDASIARWTALPQKVQKALVGLYACRARRVQDEEGQAVRAAGLEDKLDPVFSRLSAYSKRHQPGWVKGLSFGHTPDRATWYEDAVHWWNELQRSVLGPEERRATASPERLLQKVERAVAEAGTPESDPSPVLSALREALEGGVKPDDPRLTRLALPWLDALTAAGPPFKDLRRAARRAAGIDTDSSGEQQAVDATTPEPGPPADWAWWPCVRGKRAVIVGGDRREEARRRLQETFDLAALEWVPLQHENNSLRSLAASVSSGSIDLVLILRRFVPHQADEILIPACKAAGVGWVSVERGYGVERVRQAFERYLRAEAA